MMHKLEKSDPSTVAAKPANNSGSPEAESVEPREGAKGNTPEPLSRCTEITDFQPEAHFTVLKSRTVAAFLHVNRRRTANAKSRILPSI